MINVHEYESCRNYFSKYCINLTQEQFNKFRLYEDLLIEESTRQNITAVKEREAIWVRHFLDSAYLLRFLPETGVILDIGTGGGIPAIPLAILRPNLTIKMIDSERNKIMFCQKVTTLLTPNAQAICGRAEELAHEHRFRAQFDYVVSRAMANGSILSELSIPFLKKEGFLIAMKGRQYDPEIERFEPAAEKLGCTVQPVHSYTICREDKHLIIVQKTSETPSQYPRRFAKIKRSPL